MGDHRILCLSGWTQPPDALHVVAPDAMTLDYINHTPKTIFEHQGEYDLVIGWSLGGVLARQLLNSGAIQAKALVSIAAPYQFVRSEHVYEAMPSEIFEQFYVNYRDETERTKARFHGLIAKGDAKAREVRAKLSYHPRAADAQAWLVWMDYLRAYSARHHNYGALPPTLIIHGEQDTIVPPAQAIMLSDSLGGDVLMIDGAAHAPHLHDGKRVKDAIEALLV